MSLEKTERVLGNARSLWIMSRKEQWKFYPRRLNNTGWRSEPLITIAGVSRQRSKKFPYQGLKPIFDLWPGYKSARELLSACVRRPLDAL